MRYLMILLLWAAPLSAEVTYQDKTAAQWLAELEALPAQSSEAQQILRQRIPGALEHLGHASVPRLIELLEHEHPAVRLTAVRALERLGGTGQAVKPLLTLIEEEPEGGVRHATFKSLAEINARPDLVVPVLVKRLKASTPGVGGDQFERAKLIEALGRFAWRSAPARQSVLDALRDFRGYAQSAAQDALARRVGPAAIPGLVALLAGGDRQVRKEAAEALESLAFSHPGPVRPALALMQAHPDPKVRRSAAGAFGVLLTRGPEHDAWATPRLYALLEDDHPEVRSQALTSLLEGRSEPTPRALKTLRSACSGQDAALRERALELAEAYDRARAKRARAAPRGEALQRAVARLGGDDASARREALRELKGLEPTPNLVIAVRQLLDAGDPALRKGAAELLGHLRSRKGLPNVLRVAREDKQPEVRVAALRALGGLFDPAALEVVEVALRDDDPTIARAATSPAHQWGARSQSLVPALIELLGQVELRQCAADALGAIGAAEATEGLVAIAAEADRLGDSPEAAGHRVDRRFALRALGRIGPAARAATPTLEALLGSQVREVREEARAALIRIRCDAKLEAEIAAACERVRQALAKPR